MVVCVGCHLPPYPCSRLPFNTNHTQWPLEKTQYLLDLRRILTAHPRNHPVPVLRGDPIRTNVTGAAYLAGQFFCLIRRPRRALHRSSQAPTSTRENAVRNGPGITSRSSRNQDQVVARSPDLATWLTEGLQPQARRETYGPADGGVWRPAPNRQLEIRKLFPARSSEWPPASRKYSRQFLQVRVATHRNAKTVGCRRDCDAPHTLPRLKLCPGLSAERERTPGPFRRSAQPDPAEPAEPSQPRKVGHGAARAAGGVGD
jgi:hypothetical protein